MEKTVDDPKSCCCDLSVAMFCPQGMCVNGECQQIKDEVEAKTGVGANDPSRILYSQGISGMTAQRPSNMTAQRPSNMTAQGPSNMTAQGPYNVVEARDPVGFIEWMKCKTSSLSLLLKQVKTRYIVLEFVNQDPENIEPIITEKETENTENSSKDDKRLSIFEGWPDYIRCHTKNDKTVYYFVTKLAENNDV